MPPTKLTTNAASLCRLFTNSTILLALLGVGAAAFAQEKEVRTDKFRQLEEVLPTPNERRTASGAPGPAYWQQRADYVIDVEIDEENHSVSGSETITYTNNSPHSLSYLWLQLDPNLFSKHSDTPLTDNAPGLDAISYRGLKGILYRSQFDGSITISSVKDEDGKDLPHTVVKTMMRVDLPKPLQSGQAYSFSLSWSFTLVNLKKIRARSGQEVLDDGNAIYSVAQWYPRMCAYTDVHGWRHRQYLGGGEFTLEFGSFLVKITVPDDHIVASTGTLQNPAEVLTPAQRGRLAKAAGSDKPTLVVTREEADENRKGRSKGKKTWIFHADMVRDFAFASSRSFVWDAMPSSGEGFSTLCMSFYPAEAMPLWSQFATHATAQAIEVYSKHTVPYPWPVAISVNSPVGGMEYPMIHFTGARPEKDGTYSAGKKHGMISVIIHEVGHNFFPMVVNSDEREWIWMDEGFNTFVQNITEHEWSQTYPARRGTPQSIGRYMKSPNQVPIMTSADSLIQSSANAYSKTAAGLIILRETILGRELFDFAFREYARRWKFKRPMPADFFRTMEDASGVDLDWFFRGWFYTIDHTDIAITGLTRYTVDSQNPVETKARQKERAQKQNDTISKRRSASLPKRVDAFPGIKDFYDSYDEFAVTKEAREAYSKMLGRLSEEDRELLSSKLNFYVLDLENLGGMVMPVLLQLTYEDKSVEELHIPAEIWRKNNREVSKLLISAKPLASILLDPHDETADTDKSNNVFPRLAAEARIKLSGGGRGGGSNPLRKSREDEKKRKKEEAKKP